MTVQVKSHVHSLHSRLNGLGPKPVVKDSQTWRVIPSEWTHMVHPKAEEVEREVEGYFLEHWNFADDRARSAFLKAGFSHVTCLYFPLAKDDRIHFACRLLTVLFLIDDILEDMSFADGEKLNNRLMDLSKGPNYATPDRSIPAEFFIYDLWESMRKFDLELANEVLEPTFVFMRSQTDRIRLSIKELGEYLRYREKDVGKALLSALMRFSMELRPTEVEMAALRAPEENCAKHLSVVNDIYSFEKELQAARTGHAEGSFLCSAVKVLATETGLGIPATKRVLWSMVREWELVHITMRDSLLKTTGECSQTVREYLRGLEYQMSGNEHWSRTTPRYMEAIVSENIMG